MKSILVSAKASSLMGLQLKGVAWTPRPAAGRTREGRLNVVNRERPQGTSLRNLAGPSSACSLAPNEEDLAALRTASKQTVPVAASGIMPAWQTPLARPATATRGTYTAYIGPKPVTLEIYWRVQRTSSIRRACRWARMDCSPKERRQRAAPHKGRHRSFSTEGNTSARAEFDGEPMNKRHGGERRHMYPSIAMPHFKYDRRCPVIPSTFQHARSLLRLARR
jgi:hypothetical protein